MNYTAQSLVPLSGLGTNWHTLELSFLNTNVTAFFDGVQITNLVDSGTFDGQPPFTAGGIDAELYTLSPTPFTLSLQNMIVTTIAPPTAPAMLSVGQTNQVITVTWSSVAGFIYGLQSTTNLTAGNWTTLSPSVLATGPVSSLTNFIGNTPQQFYRVTSLPRSP
jgi:hypothetical protein